MPTIFTKIIAGELPSYKVYEDEYVCAILDINPIQQGHTIVIVKQEISDLYYLDEEAYDEVMRRVRLVAITLKAKFNCVRVCTFVEGYVIPHAHVHLVPTNKPEDFDKNLAHPATHAELEEAQKILSHSIAEAI